ncbi:collagenase [Kitasatospora sp. NPDC097605]|uniref:collagenase n=1 Tax=Kitasatospora sp. NPDC097605 TaxID=3157226 RepID=UPI00332D0121
MLVAVGLFTPRAQAAPQASPPPGGGSPATSAGPAGLAPQPAIGDAPATDDRTRTAPARDRAPFSTTDPERTETLSTPERKAELAKAFGESAPMALAEKPCNIPDFSRTGGALVDAVKAADLGCINSLFLLTGGDANGTFRESQMVTVADALRDNAANYPGDNSTSTAQLVLFLRAGYYVQWYHASDVGTYGTALQTSIRGALDGFFNSAHSRDVSAANAGTLGEAITLIDSAQENVRYLPVVKRLLGAYDAATHNPANMGNALNSVFTVLWRGHQTEGFVEAVQADQGVLDALYAFATANGALLGGDYTFLVYNATRELGRFLQYEPLRPKVGPQMKGLADTSSPSDRTSYQWAAVAEMAEAYDPGKCASYGTCDAPARLRAAVLTVDHTCSPSIRVLAQKLDAGQLATTCSSLNGQDAYFHSVAKDGGPVANDQNTKIEVVVFHTRFDYAVFAAGIYGIDTNNGGMYLEGKPNEAGNQPRFLAYEADWTPDFQIWNLNHEYTHYLDGRFDMYGDFDAGMTTPTVWWVEGFAEYISYGYRKEAYTAAITAAGLHTYRLSDLFDTGYGDQERVYRWGYLAVRYMLEQHRSDMDAVLAKYRAGDWNGARTLLKTTIGTRYDADFDRWLTACAAGACGGDTNPPGNQPPTAAFTSAVSGLAVTFTDGSTDRDGTIASRVWDFGDGTTGTAANPAKTYAKAGTYTVTLTVTDDKGATASTRQDVTVGGGSGSGQCTDADTRRLDRNCGRDNAAATTGNYAHFYLLLPAGVTQLKLTSTGGTGNADLYFNDKSWAYTDSYTTRSANADNTETLTITNPPAGYVFLSLYAQQGFSGASIKAEY